MSRLTFPRGFLWGAATSAAQIEGAVTADGRGESIWDRFAAEPGRIDDGSSPAQACDHYRLWREDVALLRDTGLNAYRFSIAWPRVMPKGSGPVNTRGLDFYDALVDALLAAGIAPMATLYHWDLPQALQDEGGWPARETADAFVEYTAAVAERLGDRVRHWVTHNEPWCVATLGYEQGTHAPGLKDPRLALYAAHHLLLSHGRAVEVLRRLSPGSEVGLALVSAAVQPFEGKPADREAARRADGALNRWYLGPLFHAAYPEDVIADRVRLGHLDGPELPFVRDGDLQTIAAPIDFLGANYYSRVVVRADEAGDPVAVPMVPRAERTEMDWEVYPAGLRSILRRYTREYGARKLYVTENGAAFLDPAPLGGSIHDERRVEYLRAHLHAAYRALQDGVPLAGYFVWSLLDNFEWAHGYTKPFGLYAVDFTTQRRIPKDSAAWYRGVARANAVPSAVPELA